MMTSARVVETSVITVQKQSFSRTTLTRTIKLHYYKVDTNLGFRKALSPRSTRLKANPRTIGTFFWVILLAS